MHKAALTEAERALQQADLRLQALCALDALDSPKHDGFDRIVRLIQKTFSVDAALISLIDGHRQWYKSCFGLSADEVPLEKAFCSHVIAVDAPIVVNDARLDPRFCNHQAVATDKRIRFYASVPMRSANDVTIGTVCAIDKNPRAFSDHELDLLHELAGAAMDLIELQQTASEDSLTGALTRRAFRQATESKMRSLTQAGNPIGLVALDIDHFKQVNDRYGHHAGDEVLKSIAEICRRHLRQNDLFCRMGGEEFAILLPQTSEAGTFAFAESLRTAIANRPLDCSFGAIAITTSLGCAVVDSSDKTMDTLLAEADVALYTAKRSGRNQTQLLSKNYGSHQIGKRKRQFLRGKITFSGADDPIACTITAIGEESASLIVSNAMELPSKFSLAIEATSDQQECAIIARNKRKIEVAFLPSWISSDI